MNDIPALIGDVAHGGLWARAAEPAHGEGREPVPQRACLNCGTALLGPHCHECGQRGQVHRTLTAFFHDLLHGVFHFEGKIWRTLPMLAWSPGQLTRQYVGGRRASYVSPIALFLFVVFVTFALFSALGHGLNLDQGIKVDAGRSIAQAKADLDARIGGLEVKRNLTAVRSGPQPDYPAQIAQLRSDRALLDKIALPASGPTVTGKGAGGEALARGLNAAWTKAKENPSLTVYKIQSSAYKYSWLLIPLSVPFLWLLFPLSGRYRLYDHTVFVTYSISFMLILVSLVSVAGYSGVGWLVVVPLLYMPFHMYRQLKGAYALSRWGSLWRTGAMLLFAGVALSLFAAVLVALVVS